MSKLWYGIKQLPYQGDEPPFFETDSLSWVKILEDNADLITSELSDLMRDPNTELTPYFDNNLQFPPNNWKTTGFYFWGKKKVDFCKRFPKTTAVLESIPGIVTASFNMLEPNSEIKPHYGDTNAVFRCHLGISIPEGLPKCGFTVKDQTKAWANGKCLVFLDAHTHHAFNFSKHRRYILLVDVVKPEFMHMQTSICSHVLAMLSIYYLVSLNQKVVGIARQLPYPVIAVFLYPIKLFWLIYLPFSKRFNIDWVKIN